MTVLETQRLTLRHLTGDDAEFILELLNEPAFLQNIGDRGVRSAADAARYIANGPAASYRQYGFGLYLVETKTPRIPIGICGLLQREWLDAPDIGFAFLERQWSRGYAFEAASGVMQQGRSVVGPRRILAVTAPANSASIRLLGKLGFEFVGTVAVPDAGESRSLFASNG